MIVLTSTLPAIVPEPISDRAVAIRDGLSDGNWRQRVFGAQEKLSLLQAVQKKFEESGLSWRRSLREVNSDIGWSCYLHWKRALETGSGEEWERLLDARIPPKPEAIGADIREMVVLYREVNPDMSCNQARKLLCQRFGKRGEISDVSLQKIWKEAGLSRQGEGGDAIRFEKVESFHGGAGLAILGAASLDTGAPLALAQSALKAGKETALAQECPELQKSEGRDSSGRFTAQFNEAFREGCEDGKADSRWDSDEKKRNRQDLKKFQLLSLSAEALSHRLLAMGMVGLVSQQRGFDGLSAPRGAWLAAAGQTAYMPATLDKALRELALLNVGDALWAEHGCQWAKMAEKWSQVDGESPKWLICYVDKTTDPYWSRKFALSGKVETVGRVMPCLSRFALCAGPGVPLFMSVCAGASSMKRELAGILDVADEVLGEGELRRVTVVDSEAASANLLSVLSSRENYFVTILKGMRLRTLKLEDPKDWEAYGSRDHIRTGWVTIQGKELPDEGLRLNIVQRKRLDGSNPVTTWFATDAPWDEIQPKEIVEIYLSRWPNQEQVFRNGRNGLAMEHSHGYGGEYVKHVAIETKLEKAKRSVERAKAKLEKTSCALKQAHTLSALKTDSVEQSVATKTAISHAKNEEKKATKYLEKAQQNHDSLSTMPRMIYQRDTTRENIATVASVTVMMLIEYALREYFGGLRMEFRTFIEYFVNTPTTVRTTYRRVLYQFEANPRHPERTEQLRKACEEISRRGLKRHGRRLVFEVVEPGQRP